jgi:hypothetical protein
MTQQFQPDGRATLIGSQPLSDHGKACDLILEYTPEVPTWPQLPVFPHEGMVPQFMSGMPGLVEDGERYFIDTGAADFDDQVLSFFESYLTIQASGQDWKDSRFVLTPDVAQGFFSMIDALKASGAEPAAVKGQVTGPITFCTALKDQDGRAIFYNETLKDAAVKLLALKAAWQVDQLKAFGRPVILFLDEPSLAGFGSSELISISSDEINACFKEVIDTIHEHQGLVGVHVCANTDWSLLLDSEVDVINFDANGYFDKFILYAEKIRSYLERGRCLAWGLVPTLDVEAIEITTDDMLWADWKAKSGQIASLGVPWEKVYRQALITPSCGCGSLTAELSRHVMALTRELSARVRAEIN